MCLLSCSQCGLKNSSNRIVATHTCWISGATLDLYLNKLPRGLLCLLKLEKDCNPGKPLICISKEPQCCWGCWKAGQLVSSSPAKYSVSSEDVEANTSEIWGRHTRFFYWPEVGPDWFWINSSSFLPPKKRWSSWGIISSLGRLINAKSVILWFFHY